MVEIVNPLFDASQVVGVNTALGRDPRGRTLFADLIEGGQGPEVFAATPPIVPQEGAPQFGTNPLLQAGLALLGGGNPLQALQQVQATRAAQAQQQFENQLRIRKAQREQAAVQLATQQRQRVQQALVGLRQQVSGAENLSGNQKMALGFAIDAGIATGDPTATQTLLQNVAQQHDFEAVTDDSGNIVAQRNTTTGEEIASPQEAARRAQQQIATTRRGQDVTRLGQVETQRRFEAQQKTRVVDGKIIDVSDPDNPVVKLEVKPATTEKDQFDQEAKLRGELTKQRGDFFKVRDAFARVEASAQDPSPAGDLALIFNFMKILDPGSTVREGEFANAQNAGGVDDRIQSLYNSIIRGTRLTEAQRADFTSRAGQLFAAQSDIDQRTLGQYRDLATRNNLRFENVVLDAAEPASPLPSASAAQPANPASNLPPPSGVGEFGNVASEELLMMDTTGFTPVQEQEYNAELDRRGL